MGRRQKLSRTSDQRKAMLRNLVTSVLRNERVKTTHAKAKAAQPLVEKMITVGKRGDLHSRRHMLSYVIDEDVVTKVFEEVAPRYEDRPGGYTRILKLGPRRGDGAPMAILELV